MESITLYWVLIILVIILSPENCLVTTLIAMLLVYLFKAKNKKDYFKVEQNNSVSEKQVSEKPASKDESKLPELKKEIIEENRAALMDVLKPYSATADDRLMDASINNGKKDKKAKDIRSHWNNNNWKKYYDYEFGIHSTSNSEWWQDDELELSTKHVVF